MTEDPPSEQDPNSAKSQQTGGVNIDADRVSIDGDVVGRDKVTQINTGGGAYVAGSVTVEGQGKFVGRDDNSVTISDSPGAIVADKVTVKKYLYVFRSVRQVIAFVLILIAVSVVIALGVWRTRQPRWMDGDFNIAVAQFDEVPTSDKPTIAPIIISGLFNYLDSIYKTDNLGFDIQVEHDKIDVIHSPAEAANLAKRVNANLVIYGTVSVLGEGASVTPKFWVYDALKNDTSEMVGTGQHQLEYPFQFTRAEVLDIKSGVNRILQQRANMLIDFTQALVYRKTSQYKAAQDAVQQAIDEAKVYPGFQGKETLYLIAADIARLNKDLVASRQYVSEALTINPNYARAYIAQANIFYDQHDFENALRYYEQATQLPDQPYGAHIAEKANLAMGNIFSFRFQNQPDNLALADLALSHYTVVTDSYQHTGDAYTKELAAWAYYGSGIIFQYRRDAELASRAFDQALALTTDADLKARAQRRLGEVRGN